MSLGLDRVADEKRVLWPKVEGQVKAFGRNVIVAYDVETETQGGIIIPDTAQKKSRTGTVLSVGQRCRLGIEPGDRVVFCDVWGQDQLINGTKARIVGEEHIEAIL